MARSDATAKRLIKHGAFGADLIRFPPGGEVPPHSHAGSHILFVTNGEGWLDFWDDAAKASIPLQPGLCYLIPGGKKHGIRATKELTLIAVADDHRDAAAEDRLALAQ